MSLNADTIEYLLSKGLTGDDLLIVAQRMESSERPRSAAAERQARYRRNKAKGITGDVTNDVTPPLKDNSNPPGSEANASGGEPPSDPVKDLFDIGVSLLTTTGKTEAEARSLIGLWRKTTKSDGTVLAGLVDCRAKSISNPVEWLQKRFGGARYVSASGYEYRGSDQEVLRMAEKRADWDTYWGVKVAMREAAEVREQKPRTPRRSGTTKPIGAIIKSLGSDQHIDQGG